tara:strand:- start:885 stop:1478 length:594 start_codon:yes stop_codon:yes gene_type:complete
VLNGKVGGNNMSLLSTSNLTTPKVVTTVNNSITSSATFSSPKTLEYQNQDYWHSANGTMRFTATAPNTGSNQTLVLAMSAPRFIGELLFGVVQRTNSPTNVQIRASMQRFYLSSYVEGDSDGGGGRFISKDFTSANGQDYVSNISQFWGAAGITIPSNRLYQYQHFVFDLQNLQGHTFYFYLNMLKGSNKTFKAWWD